MRFINSTQIFLPLSILLLCASIATAATIYIPQDQPTIQAGIDAAIEGDTVLVDTGRYVENINFNGKNLVLGSWFLVLGDRSYISKTVINGDSSGSVVIFENSEDSSTVLAGFTVTNGMGQVIGDSLFYGGGITCLSNSSPQLRFLTIRGNNGHGIYCSHSSPTLTGVSIIGNFGGGIFCEESTVIMKAVNIDSNISWSKGGGIYSDSSTIHLKVGSIGENLANTDGGGIYCQNSSIILEGVRVNDNASWEGSGGGILIKDSDAKLRHVTVWGNTAFFHGGGIVCVGSNSIFDTVRVMANRADYSGGGIYCSGSDVIVRNVELIDNIADYGNGGGILSYDSRVLSERTIIMSNDAVKGGGILLSTSLEQYESQGWRPFLLNNVTITGNIANQGGAIYCSNYASPILVNSVLWNDSPQEIYFSESSFWPSTVAIAYSDIQGGEEAIVTNDNGTVNWVVGNLDEDPLFVDVENGDFHLKEGSPCIDAGTAFLVMDEDTLVDLKPNEYVGSAPDMGALESPFSVAIHQDRTVPTQFALHQPYPNPFNPTTNIEFSMPRSGSVTLTMYDLLGREVETILSQHMDTGHHRVHWNAGDVPSGIYFVRMQSGDFNQVRKVTVLR